MELEGYQVSRRTKFSFSVGGIGRDMLYNLVTMYLMIYLSLYVGLDKMELVGITIIMIVIRIWDAVNDPMMGVIIDNTKTRFGKFKPWIIIGAFTNAIITVLLFTDFQLEGISFVIVFGILYLLWEMTYTINDISYWSMYPTFSVNQKERESIGSLARICANIGAFSSVVLIPIIYNGSKDKVDAFQYIAIGIVILFVLCQLLVIFGVKENRSKIVQDVEHQDDKTTLSSMFKVIMKNDQLLIISIVILLFNVGFFITINSGVFFFNYVYLNYGGNEYSLFAIVLGISQLLSLAVYPLFSRHLTRKQLFKLSIILVVIGYLGFSVFAFIPALHRNMIGYGIFGFILFFGQGLIQLIVLVLLTDTIEYGQWKLGKRHESVNFSLQPFVTKLAGAIYVLFVNGSMLLTGLYTINKKVSEYEEAAIANDIIKMYINDNITPYMQNVLSFTMLVIPLLFIFFSYLLFKKKYKIDEAFYQKIIQDLSSK